VTLSGVLGRHFPAWHVVQFASMKAPRPAFSASVSAAWSLGSSAFATRAHPELERRDDDRRSSAATRAERHAAAKTKAKSPRGNSSRAFRE
jgi:hypothetical protein